MFTGRRYMTKGIADTLPVEIEMLLWEMIYYMKEKVSEIDSLQVFEIMPMEESEYNLQIIHRQERSEYVNVISTNIDEPFEAKIFVICDGAGTEDEYSTMLLSSEY